MRGCPFLYGSFIEGSTVHMYMFLLLVQVYNASFEVSVDGPSQAKGKGLVFELQGEGNLPQISIMKPRTRSAQGECLMLFKKLLLGT